MLDDIRHAARGLARAPGFTGAAVTILACGIGLNVTMFGVVNAFLLRPLPYPESARLVHLDERVGGESGTMKVALANFADWQDRARAFTALAAYRRLRVSLTGSADAESVEAVVATTALFRVLAVRPAAGRGFVSEDAEAGVVVVGDTVWRSRYGGQALLGRTITVDGTPRTVVGIMPPGFSFPERAQVWLPARVSRASSERAGHGWWVVARLSAGRTIAQARGEMGEIGRQLSREFPDVNAKVEPLVVPYRDEVVEPEVQAALAAAMAAVAGVLLVGCVNISNLMLARAAARARDLALRAALGAGSWGLVRGLLSEAVLLAGFGVALGLLVARAGLAAATAALPLAAPGWLTFDIDLTVAVFAACLLAVCTVGPVLAPALRVSRPDPAGALGRAGEQAGVSRASWLRHAVVAAEVALATVLLVCAALVTRAFIRIAAIDPGFEAEGLVAVQVSPPKTTYRTPAEYGAFHTAFLEAVRGLPGVTHTGGGTWLPSQQADWVPGIIPDRTVRSTPTGRVPATAASVTPGYFESLGIALVRGRFFDARDGLPGTPGVVIVNRSFAAIHWPGEEPIGRRLRYWLGPGDQSPWLTVVGVVDDVLGGRGNSRFVTYFPVAQEPRRTLTTIVRTVDDPVAAVAQIRQRLATIDRNVPPASVRTMPEIVDDLYWMPRTLMRLFAMFGFVALVLAVAGVYGVVAYSVNRRTREFGIRRALGATTPRLAWLALRQGLQPAVAGLVVGLGLSMFVTAALDPLLAGVDPRDPLSTGSTTLVLLGAASASSYLPARRAWRVNPADALRVD